LNSKLEYQDLDILWNPLDFLQSEVAFGALLSNAREAEEDRCYLIELLTWIARVETHQGKLSEADTTLSEADRLLESEIVSRDTAKIRCLLERGRLFIHKKTPARARKLFDDAQTLAKNAGEDPLSVEILQLIASIEQRKSQQEWIKKAINVAESSSNLKAKKLLGSLYLSTGWNFYDLHQFEKSMEAFQRAGINFKEHCPKGEALVAQWATGKVLRRIGKTEKALSCQMEVFSELEFEIEKKYGGRVSEEIAECLHSLKRVSEAKPYFEMAYHDLSSDEWVPDNHPLKLNRLKELGKVKLKKIE